jgi:O-antigen/teichoic acid export membrane protein
MAVAPLRILLGYTVIRAMTNILGPLLNAKQQTHFTMWINIAAAVYFPIGFLIGARWGTSGIATTWVLLFPVLAIPLFHRAFHAIELSWIAFLRTLWPAFSCGFLMAVALIVAREFLPVEWPEVVRLILEIVLGICIYGGSLLLLHPQSIRKLYHIVRPPKPQCI